MSVCVSVCSKSKPTLWQTGTFDPKNGSFVTTPPTPAPQATATAGHEQGLGSCGQSLTDAKGRRVQFGWQHISLPGETSGAQSLPRVISAARGGALLFTPLPELETLHNASTYLAKTLTIAGASTGYSMLQGVDQQTGLHNHLKLNVTLSAKTSGNFSVCVQCDGAGHSGVVVSVMVDVDGAAAAAVSVRLGGMTQALSLPSTAATATARDDDDDDDDDATAGATVTICAEIFTDGLITELFAGAGEVALSHTVGSVAASGVGYTAHGSSPAIVELQLWGMEQSVF